MHIFRFHTLDSVIQALIYFPLWSFEDVRECFRFPFELCGQLHAFADISTNIIVHVSLWTNMFGCPPSAGAAERVQNAAYGVSRYHPCLIIQVINHGCVILISSLLPHPKEHVCVHARLFESMTEGTR